MSFTLPEGSTKTADDVRSELESQMNKLTNGEDISGKSFKVISDLNISDVEVKKLDMFLTEITDLDILKIDVEGYSYEILQGGIEIIQKFKPLIQVEILSKKNDFSKNVTKLTELLKSMGYVEHSKKKHYTTHWFSDIICCDYLFIPED